MKGMKIVVVGGALLALASMTGCAGTMKAIENRKLTVNAKMSDTVFLDPELLAENRKVYVRVTNTSDMQEVNFQDLVKAKLEAKGYTVTANPKEAAYTVQTNLLYMGEQKQGITSEAALATGFGGALAGATMTRGSTLGTQMVGGLVGSAIGSVVGGLVGSMIHVDTWLGVADIQIREMVAGGVSGTMKASMENGAASSIQTERQIAGNRQEYRTRVVVSATQTNIDRNEACRFLSERLGSQVAGMF
jgi:hypothetical protein